MESGKILSEIKYARRKGQKQHSFKFIKPCLIEDADYLGNDKCWVLRYDQNLNLYTRFFYQPYWYITFTIASTPPKDFSYFRRPEQQQSRKSHFTTIPSGAPADSKYSESRQVSLTTSFTLLEFYDQIREEIINWNCSYSPKGQITKDLWK